VQDPQPVQQQVQDPQPVQQQVQDPQPVQQQVQDQQLEFPPVKIVSFSSANASLLRISLMSFLLHHIIHVRRRCKALSPHK